MPRGKPIETDALPRMPAPSQRLITLHRVTIEGVLAYEGQRLWAAAEIFREAVNDPAIHDVRHEVQKRLVSSAISPESVLWDEAGSCATPQGVYDVRA